MERACFKRHASKGPQTSCLKTRWDGPRELRLGTPLITMEVTVTQNKYQEHKKHTGKYLFNAQIQTKTVLSFNKTNIYSKSWFRTAATLSIKHNDLKLCNRCLTKPSVIIILKRAKQYFFDVFKEILIIHCEKYMQHVDLYKHTHQRNSNHAVEQTALCLDSPLF